MGAATSVEAKMIELPKNYGRARQLGYEGSFLRGPLLHLSGDELHVDPR